MPVEATLGDVERLGQRLDPHGLDPAVSQSLQGRLDPYGGIEPLGPLRCRLFARHDLYRSRLTTPVLYHTVPYVKHTLPYGRKCREKAMTGSAPETALKPRDPDWERRCRDSFARQQ